MNMKQEELQQIGDYVKQNLPDWIRESGVLTYGEDPVLHERTVRVEEELKNQRELMRQGFDHMETRFVRLSREMNARFEHMDARFMQLSQDMNTRFEQVDTRLEKLDRRLFQFMIWSFSFIATTAGIVIAVLKLT